MCALQLVREARQQQQVVDRDCDAVAAQARGCSSSSIAPVPSRQHRPCNPNRISLISPLYFPYISLTFPLHFPYISLTFPLRNAQERRFRAEIERKRQQIEDSAADTLRCVERHVTRVLCDMWPQGTSSWWRRQ